MCFLKEHSLTTSIALRRNSGEQERIWNYDNLGLGTKHSSLRNLNKASNDVTSTVLKPNSRCSKETLTNNKNPHKFIYIIANSCLNNLRKFLLNHSDNKELWKKKKGKMGQKVWGRNSSIISTVVYFIILWDSGNSSKLLPKQLEEVTQVPLKTFVHFT